MWNAPPPGIPDPPADTESCLSLPWAENPRQAEPLQRQAGLKEASYSDILCRYSNRKWRSLKEVSLRYSFPKLKPTQIQRPRAAGTLRNILLKFFCAILKSASLSVKVSNSFRLRSRDYVSLNTKQSCWTLLDDLILCASNDAAHSRRIVNINLWQLELITIRDKRGNKKGCDSEKRESLLQ